MANEIGTSTRPRTRRVPWRRRFVTVLGVLLAVAGVAAAWRVSTHEPSSSTKSASSLAAAVDDAVQACLQQAGTDAYGACATQSAVTTIAPNLAGSFGEQDSEWAAAVRTLQPSAGGYELSVGIRRGGTLHEYSITRSGDASVRSCRPVDEDTCTDGTW